VISTPPTIIADSAASSEPRQIRYPHNAATTIAAGQIQGEW
jgi:hypothetical protein